FAHPAPAPPHPRPLHDALPISETIQPTGGTEYSTDGGKTWQDATDPLKISDLTGETILIRQPATDDEFASAIATVIVPERPDGPDRKSTRLNSSHVSISYAVFC